METFNDFHMHSNYITNLIKFFNAAGFGYALFDKHVSRMNNELYISQRRADAGIFDLSDFITIRFNSDKGIDKIPDEIKKANWFYRYERYMKLPVLDKDGRIIRVNREELKNIIDSIPHFVTIEPSEYFVNNGGYLIEIKGNKIKMPFIVDCPTGAYIKDKFDVKLRIKDDYFAYVSFKKKHLGEYINRFKMRGFKVEKVKNVPKYFGDFVC